MVPSISWCVHLSLFALMCSLSCADGGRRDWPVLASSFSGDTLRHVGSNTMDAPSPGLVQGHATDAAVTLFSKTSFQGTMQQYWSPSNDTFVNISIGSISMQSQDVVVALFSESSFQGTRRFLVRDCANMTTFAVRSFKILARNDMYQLVRLESKPSEVVLWTFSSDELHTAHPFAEFVRFQAGQAMDDVSGTPLLDIPPGLAVVSFLLPRFEHQSTVYTTTQAYPRIRSFRVVSATQGASLALSSVRLYSMTNHLDVRADEKLETLSFLAVAFGSFDYLIVPSGFQLVGFADMGLRGPHRIFPEGVYSAKNPNDHTDAVEIETMQSFQVLHATDTFNLTLVDTHQSVVCTGSKYQPTAAQTRFYLGGYYPVLIAHECANLYIPDGLAVVVFDRHWHLGRPRSLLRDPTTGYVVPDEGVGTLLYSVKVVALKDAPPHISYPVFSARFPPPFTFAYSTSQPVSIFPSGLVLAFGTFPSDAVLTLYDDYNFKGNVQVLPPPDVTLPSDFAVKIENMTKSYQFHPKRGFQVTSFVGCYPSPNEFDLEPIFMTIGDAISTLIYPWNHNIANVTVPKGMVVVAHSEPDFQGNCAAWTQDTVLDSFWNQSVRSLQVWNATSDWKRCPSPPVASTVKPTSPQHPTTTTTTPKPTNNENDEDQDTGSSIPSSTMVNSEPPTMETLRPPRVGRSDPTRTPEKPLTKSPPPLDEPSPGQKGPIQGSKVTFPSTVPTPSSSSTIPSVSDQLHEVRRNPNEYVARTIAAILGCIVVAAIVVVVIQRHNRRPDDTQSTSADLKDFSTLQWHDLDLLRLDCPPLPLTHLLATGATGRIFLGTFLDQPVAIKTLLSTKPAPADVQALIDEINLMGRLKSPFVVTLEGAAWSHPANLQAVMEYMNLGDLRNYLASTNSDSFGWDNKMKCVCRVAEGLVYLHLQQMVHRDLKSRNVLLDSTKGTKLADFGSSKDVVYGDTMTAV
ncbi:Aste57867_23834 [Aphanomyces stellatus]|uniref:Aste57867_23834 protein n=1 Tax=Aphanomyces stellatus TaxID=120398 RepID=A0A485LNW0_9STRA|nr:hypothetical protein As57867_023761 [Aphanomyces stellatus]VFU00478.1 Aste57867_23834 [Aphanomyces stellatus]